MTDKITSIAFRVGYLIKELSEGKKLYLKDHPYPIGMGENGDIGYVLGFIDSSKNYNERIPTAFTVSELFKICENVTIFDTTMIR